MSDMIDKDELAILLFEFEESYSKEISELTVNDFNIWPYIKTNFYFSIINAKKNNELPDQIQKRKGLTNKIKSIIRNATNLIYASRIIFLTPLMASSRKRKTLFFTFSVDKYLKDDKGKYYNHLTDGFITNKLIEHYWYIERSWNEDYKTPYAVPIDIKASKFFSVNFFYKKRYKKNNQIGEIAKKLTTILGAFFKKNNVNVELSVLFFTDLIIGLVADYKVYKLLFQRLKSELIISSEQPGTALLAAANALQIPSIDLQHGIINSTHPQYIYSSKLNAFKSKMPLPSFVGVFGEMHKNILLEKGFWQEEDIVILGSNTVSNNRRKYSSDLNKWDKIDKTILIPTQWTVFSELTLLLESLGKMNLNTFTVIVKMHPLEPENNVIEYKRIANQFPGRINISGKQNNVYDLIKNAFFVIGFDTAVLLESVALGVPCITITTKQSPFGIHSMFKNDKLTSVILPIAIDDLQQLQQVIQKAITDKSYYEQWSADSKEKSYYLYAKDYIGNCNRCIKAGLKKRNSIIHSVR